MNKTGFLLATTVGLAVSGNSVWAQSKVPSTIQVPAGHAMLFQADAKGVQIYTCLAAEDRSESFAWQLVAPDAVLYDENGSRLGKHSAGPTWEGLDGSTVVGQLKARIAAPDPDAVPWLLVGAKATSGRGEFGQVTYINRVDTSGGKAPNSGCDARQAGKTARSSYSASYLFYAAESK